jgi:glycosyltransferase involved in cell wall biosynthesis
MFDRIEEHLQNVFCGVCSVRAAAGIQNKVLEYLAMGLPCVTTAQGAEGIHGRPDQHFLLYRSELEATRHVLSVYRKPELRQHLARAGKDLISSEYDWDRLYRRIRDSVADLLEAPSLVRKAG